MGTNSHRERERERERFISFSSSCFHSRSFLFIPVPSSLMEDLKKISPSEIRLHTSRKDCWIVIHGKVYDVTKFLDDHPGGEDVLLHASGTGDATQSFEDVGHSSGARKRMENYLIGAVEGYDPNQAFIARRGSRKRSDGATPPAFHDPPTGLKGYTLPLVLLFIAIAAWYFDKLQTAAP